MVKPCTISQPGQWPWYNPWSLFTSVLLVVICLYWCVYFNAQKLSMLFFIKFSTRRTSDLICVSASGNGDRYFSHRNQSPPCSVLFPMIAWKCSKLLHKKQSAAPENKWWFAWFSCLFYFSILYVKRAGFSSIFSVPLIPTLTSLPIFFLFLTDTLNIPFGKSQLKWASLLFKEL